MTTVPAIYYRRGGHVRLSKAGRFFAGAIAAACLGLLVTAFQLTPSRGGFGTHRQLGLSECGFLLRTGLPCPACGMTTSFAWFAHGNVPASFYVQPMGFLLAVACGMTFWTSAYVATTGRPVHKLLSLVPERYYLIPILVMAVFGWAWKIYIHLHGIDGWR